MRVSKHVLKRLRLWSKYQSETTVYDAHAFLKKPATTVADYTTIADLGVCAIQIRDYLINYCGYQMLPETKIRNGKPYRVLKNNNVGIIIRRASDRYVTLMTDFYHRCPEDDDI